MKFRPCIDIHQGQVKQIVGGTLSDNVSNVRENFIATEDSTYYAELFKKDNLRGGHVIMLGSGNEEAALRALAAYPGGFQIGGGITDANATHYIENGASHIIVTSFVFKDGNIDFENLSKLVSAVGKGRIVLDLSCKRQENRYVVATDRWQKMTDYEVTLESLRELAQYCAEFLIHAVDVEGKCNGIEVELVEMLGGWTGIPMTYAGGIRSFEDMELIRKAGGGRIDFTVGSALDIFGGGLSYKEIVEKYG